MVKKLSIVLCMIFVVSMAFVGCQASAPATTPSQAPSVAASSEAPAVSSAAASAAPSESASASASAWVVPKATKEYNIGLTIADFKIPFQVAIKTAAEAEAKTVGVKLDIVDSGADANKQIASIETFIAQKKDAIIINAVATDVLVSVVKKANDAGIPVFSVNRRIGDVPVASYVGCDDVEAGYKCGELCTEIMGGLDKAGNAVLIQGQLGTPAQIDRLDGLKKYIAEKKPTWKLAADATDDWDPSKAITVTQNFLQRYPKGQLNVIMSQDPFGATSAAQVVKETGRSDLAGKIASTDMPKEVYAAIQSGEIYGTVLQDPAEQGQKSVDLAVRYLNGDKTISQWTKTDLPLVTINNYKNYKPTW